MNCKQCFRCSETYPTDDMTPDAFGDSSVLMCNSCLFELREDNNRYVLVKVPEIHGTTFALKQELADLEEYYGKENVEILN